MIFPRILFLHTHSRLHTALVLPRPKYFFMNPLVRYLYNWYSLHIWVPMAAVCSPFGYGISAAHCKCHTISQIHSLWYALVYYSFIPILDSAQYWYNSQDQSHFLWILRRGISIIVQYTIIYIHILSMYCDFFGIFCYFNYSRTWQ